MSLKKIADEGVFLITSSLVTIILFCMDEGYYDFRWMKSFGNWIIFLFYVTVLFSIQYVIFLLLNSVIKKKKLARRISFIGIFIGLYLLLFVIFRK